MRGSLLGDGCQGNPSIGRWASAVDHLTLPSGSQTGAAGPCIDGPVVFMLEDHRQKGCMTPPEGASEVLDVTLQHVPAPGELVIISWE